MLVRLEIFNFAVILHAVFEPENGLNVISGETGAGKSLLVDALDLIMGGKSNKAVVRTGCDKACVEAVFEYSEMSKSQKVLLEDYLKENGIPFENNGLIISREVSSDGKSIARINGRSIILSVLRIVTSYLVDIHGQHDTQKIFDESIHCSILDNFQSQKISPLFDNYTKLLNAYKDVVLSIRKLGSSPDELNKRREYLAFAYESISKAGFRENEEDELTNERQILKQTEKTSGLLQEINQLLSDDYDSQVVSNVSSAASISSKLSALVPDSKDYSDISSRLSNISLELSSITDEISNLYESLGFNQERINTIDNRLSLLYDMKAKYGSNIEQINAFAQKAKEEIAQIDNSSDKLIELKALRKEIEEDLLVASRNLSDARHEVAKSLSSRIEEELNDLEMPSTKFEVLFANRPKDKYFSSNGTENISFIFSANPGETPKALSKIASGGEASRIMLAIKSVLSNVDNTPTLIFDEIDTGISGKASAAVALKLKSISKSHQVLCVTHTAQIAAAADSNFYLNKDIDGNSSETKVSRLNKSEQITEVSRLLSGTDATSSITLAQELVARFS